MGRKGLIPAITAVDRKNRAKSTAGNERGLMRQGLLYHLL
jgi:hypothetical protein